MPDRLKNSCKVEVYDFESFVKQIGIKAFRGDLPYVTKVLAMFLRIKPKTVDAMQLQSLYHVM